MFRPPQYDKNVIADATMFIREYNYSRTILIALAAGMFLYI